jgi:D-alanyl-D-alanine carboxypeptidase
MDKGGDILVVVDGGVYEFSQIQALSWHGNGYNGLMVRDCPRMKEIWLLALLIVILLHACQPASENGVATTVLVDEVATAVSSISLESMASPTQPLPTFTPLLTATAGVVDSRSTSSSVEFIVTVIASTQLPNPSTPHPSPTKALATLTPTATVEPTATYWPTVTRQTLSPAVAAGLAPCESRIVTDDLLLIVTQQFALPESYVPTDLVSLTDYFSNDVTRDLALFAKAAIIEPLQNMIDEMHAVGLRPSILSAYRSYDEQALAWHWWSGQYPGRVAIMSARPGYSEHQLGTTVDFGSPELNHLFHVDFSKTGEGIWLSDNAHRYGFTLTYPPNSYAITGFKFEPWHYRYVGPELASQLFDSGQTLIQWQLANMPPPCIP